MSLLYTRNGKPLTVDGDDIFDRSGRHVGRRHGDNVFGSNGRYAGTIVGDRVVYRSIDSATIGPSFTPRPGMRSATTNTAGSAILGEEPFK